MTPRLPLALAACALLAACTPAADAPAAGGPAPPAPPPAAPAAPAPPAPAEATAPVPAAPAPSPLAETTLCTVAGAAGAEVTCPLALSRGEAVPRVAALQATLRWPAEALAFVALEAPGCAAGEACDPVRLPPAAALPASGHVLATRPQDPTQAAGELGLMIYTPKDPDATLGEAPGALVFRLARDVPADAPVAVRASRLDAATPDARRLRVDVQAGALVPSLR